MTNKEIMLAINSPYGSLEHQPVLSIGMLDLVSKAIANAEHGDLLSEDDKWTLNNELERLAANSLRGRVNETRKSTASGVIKILIPVFVIGGFLASQSVILLLIGGVLGFFFIMHGNKKYESAITNSTVDKQKSEIGLLLSRLERLRSYH
jgi:hypothetical protein